MIYNEKQKKITVSEIRKLKEALSEIILNPQQSQKWIIKAQIDALESQIGALELEAREYELIREGKSRYFECSDLSSLPRVLISARIASGMSQKDLGQALGMTAQQVQRYEATDYMGASLNRLIEISSVLGVQVRETWGRENLKRGNAVYVWDNISNVRWDKFPLKEMLKRKWFELKDNANPLESVKEYFSNVAGDNYATALHRKKFHGENKPNEYSLLAWQARVLEKATKVYSSGGIGIFDLDDSWVPDLISLSIEEFAPVKVKEFLATKGIILVFERHLPGTYLDGAAMLMETGNPVVGLTLRHDRLDNFWFVLMHELGHVFHHLFESLGLDFFDEEENGESDELEIEADQFALDSLINNKEWKKCLSRFLATEESVIKDAERLGIHWSIIAGRIRKEKNNFTILNSLVGQGEVRKIFEG